MIHVDESDPVGEVEAPFPYKDVTIKRNTDVKDYYEMLSEIGRGKFGTVYQCREKATDLKLAAKLVVVNRRDERRSVEREVDVMKKLRHPRLIQLYDAYDSGTVMCVVLELIEGGELFERVIDDDFILTEKACTVFMRQICEGIEFVHQQNILHLDLKPENILCLTKSGNRIKIIDFGLARFYDPEKKLQVLFGTPEFVAPEVVNFEQIGFGTDMWSVGVICYVLLSGLSPFMGDTDVETMANVTVAKYDFDDEAFTEISEEAKDFIKKLLVKDKQTRLTAGECLRHKWLLKKAPLLKKIEEKNISPEIIAPPSPPRPELDVTKDNLRVFVERWSEHPNSPYVFDTTTHEIMVRDQEEDRSIGGCSPSPRSSLESSPDSVLEFDSRRGSFLTPRLNPVERRASDSSCFIHRRPDVSMRVNLAEEIKKLSDHLYMLSTMNTDLNNDKKTDTFDTKKTVSDGLKLTNGFHNDIALTKNGVNKSNNIVPQRLNASFFEERRCDPVTSNMPWANKSNKPKKITSLSRDVPDQPFPRRGSSFEEEFDRRRDRIDRFINDKSRKMSREINPARRTKDLLLQLLDKWDDDSNSDSETSSIIPQRHKSISMEWSEADKVAQNSISSLNAFFQRQSANEKHKPKTLTTNGIK